MSCQYTFPATCIRAYRLDQPYISLVFVHARARVDAPRAILRAQSTHECSVDCHWTTLKSGPACSTLMPHSIGSCAAGSTLTLHKVLVRTVNEASTEASMHVLKVPIGPSMPCAKAEHRLLALSARRRRQQANLEHMLTSETAFLVSEGRTACPRRKVMPGAHEVGEEVMFTAWNSSSSTHPAFAPAARSAAKAVSQW